MKSKSIIFLVTLAALSAMQGPALAFTIEQVVNVPGSRLFRVIDGIISNEFWIADVGNGLRLLEEVDPGEWSCSGPLARPVGDICGPDTGGSIYCTDDSLANGSTVYVFDTGSHSISQTLLLGADIPIPNLCLSSTNTTLYVLGQGWPRFGEYFSFIESGGHRDSGIIWKIDTSTMTVVDQGFTAALPEVVFYAESELERDKLLVSAQEVVGRHSSWASLLDFINTGPDLPRDDQMLTPHNTQQYRLDFVDWSDSEPLVAMCCTVDPQMDDPDYMAGLWIIDTDLAQVVQTLTIEYEGRTYGVKHACVSQIDPCDVYITPDVATTDKLFVIDHDSGEVLDTIPLPADFTAEFIYEIPDGRLIVTGGESEKILIIDPSS